MNEQQPSGKEIALQSICYTSAAQSEDSCLVSSRRAGGRLSSSETTKPPELPGRSESLLLYLGGGQLVAALPVGSLRVAVDQHPLELELEERLDLLLHV